jgi:hypothetical protein
MSIKTNNLLLVLMILALVITPLRGAWAFSTPATVDSTPHCDQMDMSSTAMQADVPYPGTTPENGHQCETGCNSDCCDGSCNACAHSVVSLSNTIVFSQNLHNTPMSVTFPVTFPHRTIIPPLRPPASL